MDDYVPVAIRSLGRLFTADVLIYWLTSFVFSAFKYVAFC